METVGSRPASLNMQILRKYDSLTRSERKVADLIMGLGGEIIGYSISGLAAACSVSEPTVVRFCKSLGYGGIKELKKAAVQAGVSASAALSREMMAIDDIRSEEDMADFVFHSISAVLEETRSIVDMEAVSRAIRYLSDAKYVKVVGFGGSSIIARHAQHYLRMSGKHADMVTNYLPNDPLLENYSEGDVVLAVSFSGNTSMVVDIVEDARSKGAKVVGLTAWGDNQIHKLADVSLQSVYSGKGIIPGLHAIERVALIALVDILLTGVYLRKEN